MAVHRCQPGDTFCYQATRRGKGRPWSTAGSNGARRARASPGPATRESRRREQEEGRLQGGALVAIRLALENHELGLEEVREALVQALAADARLLEPAEADAEVRAHRVVPDRARPEPRGDLAGPVHVIGENRR